MATDSAGYRCIERITGWRYRLAHSHWPAIAALVLALVILAGILVGLDVGGLRSRMAGRMGIPVRVVKLAVLPFANPTGDPEQEYLSDGLTQEMIAQLDKERPRNSGRLFQSGPRKGSRLRGCLHRDRVRLRLSQPDGDFASG